MDEGLYLLLPDETTISLNKANIEKCADEFWNGQIAAEVMKAAEFGRCHFCPMPSGICDAIRPVLPLIAKLDQFLSCDKIKLAYHDGNGIVYFRDSTMSEALKYISILSLTTYCRSGQAYRKLFMGIVPAMNGKDIAQSIYLNLFFLCEGNRELADRMIRNFKQDITHTSRNQAQRLNLVCRNDAFMNAFVSTQIITELLSFKFFEYMEKKFNQFSHHNPPAQALSSI